jgi:thiamine pyrophosphate-dependent acetolactate synthase large subunit-like protein
LRFADRLKFGVVCAFLFRKKMQREEEASGAQQLPVSEEEMRRAADLIAHAKRLVVFSGAGISAESAPHMHPIRLIHHLQIHFFPSSSFSD